MNKLLGVGLIGAAIVGTVAVAKGSGVTATPEEKTCNRLADLCSTSSHDVRKDKDFASCPADLADAKKFAGAPAVDRSMTCVAEANTCTAASVCLATSVGMGALGEAMKGFGSALSR